MRVTLSARDRTLLARWAWIVAGSAACGAVYGVVVSDVGILFDTAVGVANGVMMGGLCGAFELFYVQRPIGEPFRRLPLPVHLAIRSLFYVVVIVGTIYVWTVFVYPGPVRWQFGDRDFTLAIIVSSLIALTFNVAMSMQRMVGGSVMTSYITGRYYRPREEERVFLFLDLADSTAIAERIGHVAFHRLLNRFCYDVSEPIAAHHGEIYKYVGDEVIVSWPLRKGTRDARCVRCCFEIQATIDRARATYLREFGLVPSFRAALHAGIVVTGELGDSKQEIAFLGDTVNTTARIARACRALDVQVLASAAVLDRVTLPQGLRSRSLGAVPLRGKVGAVDLFRLDRAESTGERPAEQGAQDPGALRG